MVPRVTEQMSSNGADPKAFDDLIPAEQLALGRRIQVLDGLRGIACLMVLLHHSARGVGRSFATEILYRISLAGWAGVDLFFVLSGFLITGILIDARGRRGGTTRFLFRRAFRILPLAYTYLAVIFFSPFFRHSPWYRGVYSEQGWYWLYANNWLVLRKPALEYGLLAHFWSLAIEEQFYLFWPLILLPLTHRGVVKVCSLMLGASLLARVAADALRVSPGIVYELTPTRLDGLLAGALLAAIYRCGWLSFFRGFHRRLLVTAVALSIALLWPERGLPYGHRWVTVAGPFGLALIFALFLLALLVSPKDSLARALCEHRPLVYLGRVGYGFYIFHYPIVMLLTRHWPVADGSLIDSGGFFCAALATTLSIATMSWFAFEQPLLQLRPKPDGPGLSGT